MFKYKSIVTIIILLTIFLFFLSYPVITIHKRIINKNNKNNYRVINYEEIYPFDNNDKYSKREITTAYFDFANKITKKITSIAQENILFRENFLDIYGIINRYIGTKYIVDDETTVVKAHNNSLLINEKKADLEKSIQSIIYFNEYVKKNTQSNLLYIQFPSKKLLDIDIVPGIIEYKNDENKDSIIEALKQNDVDVLDLRIRMPLDYQEYMDKFYISDHHWKTETAFEMTKYIINYLNNEYDYGINETLYLDSNYAIKEYKDIFLGSLGKKTTKSFTSVDDFKLIVPKFETSIKICISEYSIDEEGTFDSLINYNQLGKNSVYNTNPYGCFLYGDNGLVKINNPNGIDKKVLIIKDSYANPVISYLSLGIKNIDVIDFRAFNGNLDSFLKENSYDDIIIMYNAYGETEGTIEEKSLYNFKLNNKK